VWDTREVAEQLGAILPDLDSERLRRRLDANTRYVEIARNISPATRRAILLAGQAGVYTSATPTRIYPKQRAAAHVIGYAGRDLQGLAGAELAFDAELTEPNGRVSLSIDVIAQHRVESVLRERMAYYRAEGASAVLMRVGTGEILAMASLPDFDPNLYQDAAGAGQGDIDPLFNQASSGVYELGSVFKPLALAAGLNAGTVTLEDTFDAGEPVHIGRFTIRDYRGENRVLTAREMILYSSNIAAARMADQITGPVLSDFYRDLRLFEAAPIELAETARPQLPERWGRVQTMTAAYGHGLSVSPLALTAAYAALANGGVYTPPTLRPVAPGETVAGEAVTTPAIAAQVLGVMRENIVRSQTGSADVPGLVVAGSYVEGNRFNTFVAVFPFDDPQYVLTVTLDRPQPTAETHGFATAGWTAMPTAGAILTDLAGVLDIHRRDADPSARADLVREMFLPRAPALVPAEEPVPVPQPRTALEATR
jgi:cell division protein FtsI (penicillin-binding protein 3)